MFISFCDSVPGDSGVPSRKSRLLMCLIGNTGLLYMQCRGIEPHFPESGMSHGISRLVARNLVYILELQRGRLFETPLCSAKSGLLFSYEGHLRNLN